MDNTCTGWRKASYSNGQGSCVEVGDGLNDVLVRDTKQEGRTDRTVVAFSAKAWRSVVADIKNGKLT